MSDFAASSGNGDGHMNCDQLNFNSVQSIGRITFMEHPSQTSEAVISESAIRNGRGPRLPNSRITVQDLLPHFKRGESDEEIAPWYPTIGHSEIQLLRQYYIDHTDEVLAYEKDVAEYHDDLKKKYHRPSALDNLSPEDRIAYLKDKLAKRLATEANGVHHPAG